MRLYVFLPVTLFLMAFVLLVNRESELVVAQSPTPNAFAHDICPGCSEPADGASVLVVEGVCAGIGGYNYSIDLIVYVMVAAINAGRNVITEVTPSNYHCGGTVQDWKNVMLEIVTRVKNGAPNAPTYWGGLMLDEEDEYWQGAPGSVAAYQDLNQAVHTLMLTVPGISWYYTENFSGENVWSYNDFYNITYTSFPAPQVATSYMVSLTNHLTNIDPTRQILVTWSGAYPINTMYGATSQINGSPHVRWGLYLSNCFGVGIGLPCNDFDFDFVTNPFDNCPYFANGGQENSDANYIDMPSAYPSDDFTWVNSGTAGDVCDPDDDNDGRDDGFEASGCAGSGATNPTMRDTDGDFFLDGAECLLGTNATNASSKPSVASCGSTADSDGDKIADRLEFCYYNSVSNTNDTDFDKTTSGARDGCEVVSVNHDRIVNPADQGILVAAMVGNLPYHPNVDFNKDGNLNPADQGMMASLISPAGQCP